MFGWLKKKTEIPKDSGPTIVHPKHKATTKTTKTEAKPVVEAKPKETGLSKEDIENLRKSEFDHLGIPYGLILAAEAKGVRGINPQKLASEITALNSKLIAFGFNIRISNLEGFECQLLYLDYQRIREANQKTKGVILPDHSLIDIIVLREAEKIVRSKYELTANPTAGEEAKKFQLEVRSLFESLWNKSIDYQLRQQAQRRIRRERNLPGHEPLIEAEVTAMIAKIKAERAAIPKIK